jgi:hypothetical protein
MRTGVLSLIFAVLAVGCLAGPAAARPYGGDDGRSLDQILPQIRERHPGTLYDADGPFIGADGRAHYRIKWKTPEGRVMWFDADARSGRVTNMGGRRDNDFFDDRRGDPDMGRERRRHRDDGAYDDPFRGGDWRERRRERDRGGPPGGGWGGGGRGDGGGHGGGRGGRHGRDR